MTLLFKMTPSVQEGYLEFPSARGLQCAFRENDTCRVSSVQAQVVVLVAIVQC